MISANNCVIRFGLQWEQILTHSRNEKRASADTHMGIG